MAKKKATATAASVSARDAAILLKSISDPTRLQLVLEIGEEQVPVAELCRRVGMSQPAVSHHLALLRHASIVMPQRNGKSNLYSLTERGEALAKIARQLTAEAA